MKTRTVTTALVFAATLMTQLAASAGELSLFEHHRFGGREVTLRQASPNLVDLDFNDQSSSMVVRSGRWEVCVGANFSGDCEVFGRGQYPTLDRFNDKISSVREVRSDDRRDGRDGRDGQGWQGRQGRADRDDRHERSDREDWQDRQGRDDRQGRQDRPGAIELFSQPGLQGNSIRVERDTANLAERGFNDRTGSLVIESGVWEICSDGSFRGQCRVFGPGQYRELEPNLTRSISSARRVASPGPSARQGAPMGAPDSAGMPGGDVELFSEPGFGGQRFSLRRDARTLDDAGFNDRAGSLIVRAGRWEACEHKDFGGQCMMFSPGRYDNLGPMNNAISSLRRVR
jgi:Beta/Gamma crystallin